jgi:hypothetical protein
MQIAILRESGAPAASARRRRRHQHDLGILLAAHAQGPITPQIDPSSRRFQQPARLVLV